VYKVANRKNQNGNERDIVFSVDGEKQKRKAWRNGQPHYYEHIHYSSIIKYPACEIKQATKHGDYNKRREADFFAFCVFKKAQNHNHTYLTYRGDHIKGLCN